MPHDIIIHRETEKLKGRYGQVSGKHQLIESVEDTLTHLSHIPFTRLLRNSNMSWQSSCFFTNSSNTLCVMGTTIHHKSNASLNASFAGASSLSVANVSGKPSFSF